MGNANTQLTATTLIYTLLELELPRLLAPVTAEAAQPTRRTPSTPCRRSGSLKYLTQGKHRIPARATHGTQPIKSRLKLTIYHGFRGRPSQSEQGWCVRQPHGHPLEMLAPCAHARRTLGARRYQWAARHLNQLVATDKIRLD